VQTPAAPSMRRRPPSIDSQATSALSHATAESADQRSVPPESRPRSGYRSAPEFCRNAVAKVIFRDGNRYFDTEPSSISAIPFTKNQRIREQPTRREAVWEAKRACTFNGQFFGWGGARVALQNHDLDTCGGNCADACCRNRPHERVHFLVNRCDGCHSRYEHADRLPNRDEHSWSPGGCIIKVGALNVSALCTLTARA
jgi:hypothetical protein